MCGLNDRFNNTRVDRNISAFYNIRNIYDFQIGFQLRKSRRHDIFQFNGIYIFDVVLNGVEIRLGYNLVCCNNEILMISVDKVSQDFRLDIFNALLMLAIYSLDKDINLKILLEPIRTIICCLESPFVVMLILSFTLLGSLIVLWISSIFFEEILGKLSLIFSISLILGNNTCVYECLFLLLKLITGFLSLKNLDFSKIFLHSLGRIGGGILEISTFLPALLIFAFLLGLLLIFFVMNFNITFC